MTTLVGILAERNKPGVILASDLSRTTTTWQQQGDVAYKHQTRAPAQKIHINRAGDTAIAMSGVYDNLYKDFLAAMIEGQIDFHKATEAGFFEELQKMNLYRWDGRVPNNEVSNALLVATNFGSEPKLYTCFPLGKTEERTYTSIGSGSGYALEFINNLTESIPRSVTVRRGIDIAIGALENAEQDIYTGGADIAIISPKRIDSYGASIEAAISRAKKEKIAEIKRNF